MKTSTIKKLFTVLIIAVITAGCLSGCSENNTTTTDTTIMKETTVSEKETKKLVEKETTKASVDKKDALNKDSAKTTTGAEKQTTVVAGNTESQTNVATENSGSASYTEQPAAEYTQEPETYAQQIETQQPVSPSEPEPEIEQTTAPAEPEPETEQTTECVHSCKTVYNQIPVYDEVYHPAVTHEETTYEMRPLYMKVSYCVCHTCWFRVKTADSINGQIDGAWDIWNAHTTTHGGTGSHIEYENEIYDYEEVAVTKTVVDQEEWWEEVIDHYDKKFSHYECKKCGEIWSGN